jgi:Na+/phosphate symporter
MRTQELQSQLQKRHSEDFVSFIKDKQNIETIAKRTVEAISQWKKSTYTAHNNEKQDSRKKKTNINNQENNFEKIINVINDNNNLIISSKH